MTPDQEKKLEQVGQEIHKIFPEMHGQVYFRFNLKPDRKSVNMNYGVEMSKILNSNK